AYELFAGHAPFHSRTPQRVLAAHMAETPPSLATLRPDLSPGLVHLVMGCLAKDPEARPQSAGELVRTIDAIAGRGESAPMPVLLMPGLAAFRRAVVL